MSTNVVMPQMGESIAEGTVVRWIKNVGERVERDEPICEISTDKVDAEVPSPAAGVLTEIRVQVGDTVPVNSVVAVIGQAADPGEAAPRAGAAPDSPSPPPAPAALPPTPAPTEAHAEAPPRRSSPLVRRIARELQVDLERVPGSGAGGRVTKKDILAYVEQRGRDVAPVGTRADAGAPPSFGPGEDARVVPLSVMRRAIADRMLFSLRTSAHVHSVVEVDFTEVARIRASKKSDYARSGARLTYLAFIARATVSALQAVPVVNASIEGDDVVYRRRINLGIAVALEHGLIVPVIKRAEEKNVLGLSRAIQDLADRARTKRLSPDDVQDGTFTITNPGVFGTLLGTPIINQPQVAILAVGVIEKRPVVIDDAIAIRLRAHLTLGFDHRLIDGAVADTFLSRVRQELETFDPNAV